MKKDENLDHVVIEFGDLVYKHCMKCFEKYSYIQPTRVVFERGKGNDK